MLCCSLRDLFYSCSIHLPSLKSFVWKAGLVMAFAISEREVLHARGKHPLNRMHWFSSMTAALTQGIFPISLHKRRINSLFQSRGSTALEPVLSHYSDWAPVVTVKA